MSKVRGRQLARVVAVLAGFTFGSTACTDGPDAPVRPTAEEVRASPSPTQAGSALEVSTFLWTPTPQGAEFLSAYHGAPNGARGALAFQPLRPSLPEIAALQREVQNRSPIFHPAWRQLESLPPRAGVAPLRRLSLQGPRIERLLPDGRSMTIQMGRPGPSGEPAGDLVVQIDGRIVSLNQYTFQKRGGRWEVKEALVTTFDEQGRPKQVLQQKMRGGQPVSTEILQESPGRSPQPGRQVLPPSIPPDVVAAFDGHCLAEQLSLASASMQLSLALSALSWALASCVVSGGAACPAVIAAMAWVAIAMMDEAAAMFHLNACLASSRPGNPGEGGAGYVCSVYYVEVSYDGGRTWELQEIIIICPR